eukprot:TRINITY_DN32373_c0_g1_i1.p1 TRINITY_DN32373_c0_g1~~TRINITY_DN32373_c0_g1_i1.p1  ORF type:complete len:681 (-),score=98.55 TRINITY_DN32373_c0_g1_i1:39-2081(-)
MKIRIIQLLFLLAVLFTIDATKTASGKASAGGQLDALSLLGSGGLGSMDLSALEASLMSMAREGATPELKPFIEQIDEMVEDLKTEVDAQANKSQKKLDDAWTPFKECNWKYQNVWFNVTDLLNQYRNCTSRESGFATDWLTCTSGCQYKHDVALELCTQFENAAVNHYPPTDKCLLRQPIFDQTTRPHMQRLMQFYKQSYDAWYTLKIVCDNAKQEAEECEATCTPKYSAWQATVMQCNADQRELEGGACQAEEDACGKYVQCYNTTMNLWMDVNTTVAEEEIAFTAEYRGLLRIECLLDAFLLSINGSQTLSKGVEDCQKKVYTGSTYIGHLWIYYYDLSQNPFYDCLNGGSLREHIPGTDEWINKYYSLPPIHTQANACESHCCGSTPSNTTTAAPTLAGSYQDLGNGLCVSASGSRAYAFYSITNLSAAVCESTCDGLDGCLGFAVSNYSASKCYLYVEQGTQAPAAGWYPSASSAYTISYASGGLSGYDQGFECKRKIPQASWEFHHNGGCQLDCSLNDSNAVGVHFENTSSNASSWERCKTKAKASGARYLVFHNLIGSPEFDCAWYDADTAGCFSGKSCSNGTDDTSKYDSKVYEWKVVVDPVMKPSTTTTTYAVGICVDQDSEAIRFAADQSLSSTSITGCSDLASYCQHAQYGDTLRSTCCITCSNNVVVS